MQIRYSTHARQRMRERKVSETMVQINYDPQADAIYIRLREGEVDNTLPVGKYIYADVDAEGVPLGLEILFASRVMADKELTSVSFNITQAVPAYS